MAGHIEESCEERGLSVKESEKRAWATVNKMTGGGKKAVRDEADNKRQSESVTFRITLSNKSAGVTE